MTLVLRGLGADVVIDESAGVPTILHWGAPLGDIDAASVGAALHRPGLGGGLDVEVPVSVVPMHGDGFVGRPGLEGHRRRGAAWAPRFRPDGVELVTGGVLVHAIDPVAELRLSTRVTLDHVLRVSCELHNLATDRYLLDRLAVTLPVPTQADDLVTFHGRWTREFGQVRGPWRVGAQLSEQRSGRTSHDHPSLVIAGSSGFGEWGGEVWVAHLGWSGNHSLLAEHLADGRRYLQLGELLHPGEVALEAGATYRTPEVVAAYSNEGLTPATWCFHRAVRARLPTSPRPRPVLLNTWEAVYFDHDADRLRELATVAAGLGVERFVLDDGWFGSRRDDTSGLGDWIVSADVYPQGLAPLIQHVRALGMDFGIWVEPEMVSPDSDLFRAHPDWALQTGGYAPVLGRRQLVLDLARPEAYSHVLGQLDALLADHDIAFVKWDMNRPHAQGSGAGEAAGAHANTMAVYRMIDELRARHPGVEIESCASGGGRIDHEILRRTDRVWTSDSNDPLERQSIQRGASLLVPPEVMGAHIGPPRAHTTGRSHSLAFRTLTAMFGHLGVEWNLLRLSAVDLDRLREGIALHRRFRALLHSGDSVRFDPQSTGGSHGGGIDGQTAVHAHGVYATDRSEAVVAVVQLTASAALLSAPLRLPGLTTEVRYRVERVALPAQGETGFRTIELTGRQLAVHGVQLPALRPESGMLLHLTALAP
jgi:alpha-galactosidase